VRWRGGGGGWQAGSGLSGVHQSGSGGGGGGLPPVDQLTEANSPATSAHAVAGVATDARHAVSISAPSADFMRGL
jgi:hypothetical protein